MGSLWEPYGKGVPFWGAPRNSLDIHTGLVLSMFDFLGGPRDKTQ